MVDVVLVPGGWSGGWAFASIARELRARGHEVFTPTLTGLGERSHLMCAHPNLDTHIDDVANVLLFERLSGVILCAHSYAGMVISGVADRLPERIAALVYADAFVPEDGQSWWDLAGDYSANSPLTAREWTASASRPWNIWTRGAHPIRSQRSARPFG